MTTIPVRAFGTAAPAFRTGAAGLWAASTGTPPTTNVTTTCGYGTGTGSRQVIPGTANTTVGSAGASATNKGWRDESYSHINQNINPTRLSGQWDLLYSLAGGVLASTCQMTIVVYAVTSSNVTRELFRNTSGNISISTVETSFRHTFTPSDIDLVVDEILQYEFFLNVSVNGNTITGTTITFRAGLPAGATPVAQSSIGTAVAPASTNTIIAVLPRGVSDSAPATDAVNRLKGAFRTQSENALAVDTLARSIIANRALSENVFTVPTADRMYGSFRSLSESIPIGVDSSVRALNLGRGASEAIPTSTTVATSFKGNRAVAETIPTTDSPPDRFLNLGRGVSSSAPATDVVDRLYGAMRSVTGSAPATDAVARGLTLGRDLSENIPTVATQIRLITLQRGVAEYPPGVTPDFPSQFPTKVIAGFVNDSITGLPVSGCTVKLFRESDDKLIATTITDVNGAFSFVRDLLDTSNTYWTLSYIAGAPQRHGVSDRGQVGV